ncbi:MAG TPA: hypothetical protein VJ553_04545 [Candidatus Paceibacterota bacterium]|nr:hypothetical protein [Candidatus Paceibacterota bacterium]
MTPEKFSTSLDTDLVYPESRSLEAADVVNALNEEKLEVYIEYQRQLAERADKDPRPESRTLMAVELAKVCYVARDKLTRYAVRIPLWQRHLDTAYLDAFERHDTAMLESLAELIGSYEGRVPTGEDMDALEREDK